MKTKTATTETTTKSRNTYLSKEEKYIINYVFSRWMETAKKHPLEKLMIERFTEVQDKFNSVEVEPIELPF